MRGRERVGDIEIWLGEVNKREGEGKREWKKRKGERRKRV